MSACLWYIVKIRRIIEEEVELLAEPIHIEEEVRDQFPNVQIVSIELKPIEET